MSEEGESEGFDAKVIFSNIPVYVFANELRKTELYVKTVCGKGIIFGG